MYTLGEPQATTPRGKSSLPKRPQNVREAPKTRTSGAGGGGRVKKSFLQSWQENRGKKTKGF